MKRKQTFFVPQALLDEHLRKRVQRRPADAAGMQAGSAALRRTA